MEIICIFRLNLPLPNLVQRKDCGYQSQFSQQWDLLGFLDSWCFFRQILRIHWRWAGFFPFSLQPKWDFKLSCFHLAQPFEGLDGRTRINVCLTSATISLSVFCLSDSFSLKVYCYSQTPSYDYAIFFFI